MNTFTKNNKRTQEGIKHSSNCYLTVNGILFMQWTDEVRDKEHGKQIKKDLISQGYKAIIRTTKQGGVPVFYRVYREVKKGK